MQTSLTALWLRRIALFGAYAGLFMPLIFVKEVIFPFVFSKLLFFQIVIGLTFSAYLLLAWMDPRVRPRRHALLLAVGAYFIAMGLSVAFSIDPLRSWWGNQERMNGFFTLLHFFAWLVMATGLWRTWAEWEKVLRIQVIVGGLVALTAIWQKWVNPEVFLYKAGPRVGGILDNPIYQGMFQMFMFFLLALLWLKTKAQEWRITYGVLALLGVGGFIASQSRGPLVGLFAGIFVSAIVFGLLSEERRNKIIAGAGLAGAIAAYGALYLMRGTELVKSLGLDRFVNFSTTASTRLIAWKIAWEAFTQKPLVGWGLDTFHHIFSINYNPQSLRFSLYETWFDRAHNTVLDVLSMTGILGFVTFMAIFVVLFWSLYRAYKRGDISLAFTAILTGLPVAYFVQNLFVFDHPAGFMLSYMLFALVIAATTPGFFSGQAADEVKGVAKPFPAIAAGVLILASLLMVWRTSVLPAQASYYSIRASQYFPQPQALEDIQHALKIKTPYRDEQTFLLSRALVGAGDQLTKIPQWEAWLNAAKQAGNEELARHPQNAYIGYVYARLLSDTAFAVPGQDALAEKYFKQSIEWSPRRQQLYEGLSRLYLRGGRVEDALKQLRTVQELDAENGYGDWLMGVITMYDLQNEPEGARLIIASVEKPYPYVPANNRELVPVLTAYRVANRAQDMDRWVDAIQWTLSAGEQPFYQFAYQARLAGRRDLEEKIMTKTEAVVPGFRERYLSAAAEIEATNVSSTTRK